LILYEQKLTVRGYLLFFFLLSLLDFLGFHFLCLVHLPEVQPRQFFFEEFSFVLECKKEVFRGIFFFH